MHSDGSVCGTPCPNESDHVKTDPCEFRSETSSPDSISNDCAVHVLSVGRMEHGAISRDELSESPGFDLSNASDYRELWSLSKHSNFHMVVFHNSLCSIELEEAARLVRSRWPAAKILIIRSGEISLDNALYDLRLVPRINSDNLLSVLSELIRPSESGARQNAA